MELLWIFTKRESGQLLIEVLMGMAIAAIILPALFLGFFATKQGKAQQSQRIQAIALMKEAEEVVRSVREKGWSAFSANGVFHPVITNNAWDLISGSENIDGFTRTITISDVFRDQNGVVVESGGTLDPSVKRVYVSVSWEQPYTSLVNSTMYIARYLQNTANTQTSLTDFSAGTTTNTTVINNGGGEIMLSANSKGQWCSPNLSIASILLPGTPNALTATEGNVYLSTGATTNANQDSFAHMTISDTSPPTGILHGKLKGYKTSAVFGEPDWGYITTSNDAKEVVVVNLNQFDDIPNKIYHEQGYFNTTTDTGSGVSTDANTIFIMNNKGYVTAGNYLYVFDLSSKSGSRPKIGKRIQFANSGNTAGEIYGRVVGDDTFIYIAIQGSTVEEIKIANVTDPNNPNKWKVIGWLNVEPNNCSTLESGKAIYVNPAGTRSYISSTNDTNFKEFFIIDTNDKTSPQLVGGIATNPPCTNGGGYEAGGMNPEQSVVVSLLENRAILVGKDATGDSIDSEEYQVLDLSDEANPTKCGGLQLNQGILGVASVRETDGDTYSYIIDGNNMLKIIQGGPDGTYLDSGTYESVPIDLLSSAALNRLSANTTLPATTSLQFQIAATQPVGGSCSSATYVYVGPDGTPNTYFPASGGSIPLSGVSGFQNPSQCVRYKAFLATTDLNVTPQLLDATINFSP